MINCVCFISIFEIVLSRVRDYRSVRFNRQVFETIRISRAENFDFGVIIILEKNKYRIIFSFSILWEIDLVYLWKFLLELFLNNVSKEKKGFIKRIISKGCYFHILLLNEFLFIKMNNLLL